MKTEYPYGKRGFAGMSPEKQRAIASRGGKVAHERGTAHKWDKKEASAAGRKGGAIISKNIEHMKRISSLGGLRRAANLKNKN